MEPSGDERPRTAVRDSERSMLRDTAADVADDMRGVALGLAQPVVEEVVSRVAFMIMAVLLVPVGIAIVAVGFVLMALAYNVFGSPTGALASAITVGGLLGIAAALFFSLRALYRRLPSVLRGAYGGSRSTFDPMSTVALALNQPALLEPAPTPVQPPTMPVAAAPTLSELDARLALDPPPADTR